MSDVLDDFIRQELSERLVGRIEATVMEARINPTIAIREFDGDVYDLTFNFESSEVTISNVLDAELTGISNVPMDIFLSTIGAKC